MTGYPVTNTLGGGKCVVYFEDFKAVLLAFLPCNCENSAMARLRHRETARTALQVGEHLRTWRLLLGLSAQQVSERAGINPSTLSRLESGDPGVSYTTLLDVLRALGLTGSFEHAINPWESDLGRARAMARLPQRIR